MPEQQSRAKAASGRRAVRHDRSLGTRQFHGGARSHHRQRRRAAHRGLLAVSPNEGTWVITSYAVAEAITVPLTGWLAPAFRRGPGVRDRGVGFGICSLLCGLAPSLSMLVVFRVLQGFCGGPLMPMSQTLLMRITPPERAAGARPGP